MNCPLCHAPLKITEYKTSTTSACTQCSYSISKRKKNPIDKDEQNATL
jgi:uncharacterized paraquat-inducible protein A